MRDGDHIIHKRTDLRVVLGYERDHPRAARTDFFDVAECLFKQGVLRRDRDYRRALLDERDRAVLELACGIGLGLQIGDLLEL